MRKFKLFILTICIISNIGEYNAFCSNDADYSANNAINNNKLQLKINMYDNEYSVLCNTS